MRSEIRDVTVKRFLKGEITPPPPNLVQMFTRGFSANTYCDFSLFFTRCSGETRLQIDVGLHIRHGIIQERAFGVKVEASFTPQPNPPNFGSGSIKCLCFCKMLSSQQIQHGGRTPFLFFISQYTW